MKILFWNVDTQRDFIDKSGAMYVQGAEKIRPNLKRLTEIAKTNNVQVVNTGDCHTPLSKELSMTPDYVNTFPPHCLPTEDGIDFIPETAPESPYVIDYLNDSELNVEVILRRRNLVIYKDDFDVFIGNKKTARLVQILNPELIVVYGVATNVCVDKAVQGLLDRGKIVYVVSDAIKEVSTIPVDNIYSSWKNRGVKMVTVEEVAQIFAPPVEPKQEKELVTPTTEPQPEPKIVDTPPEAKPEDPIPTEPKPEEKPVEEAPKPVEPAQTPEAEDKPVETEPKKEEVTPPAPEHVEPPKTEEK